MNWKRLIEVDLPINTISKNSREDQNVKKGHLHSLHVWWATRPLAACRAVILATLLPDPADPNCPEEFKQKVRELLRPLKRNKNDLELRQALLDFIAEFSAWENSIDREMIKKARELIQSVYGDEKPLVVDPFAGIGSIPFEALRVGADAFASDLNPVACLLLKTALEYLPAYGERLAKAVEKWGKWVRERAVSELKEYYPPEPDGSIPLAYLWARTIRCEGPGCGAEVPLVGLLWLSRKKNNLVALRYYGDKREKKVKFEIFHPKSESEVQPPIVKGFKATCPVCGYTTPYRRVREQLRAKNGGTKDAKLIAVITLKPNGKRGFRLAEERDFKAVQKAISALEKMKREHKGRLPLIPTEPTPDSRGPGASRAFSLRKYNINTWGDLFTPRQALALCTFVKIVREAYEEILKETKDEAFARAVTTCLALVISDMSHNFCSTSYYIPEFIHSTFQGSGMPMKGDFIEMNPLSSEWRGFLYFLERVVAPLKREGKYGLLNNAGIVHQSSATLIPLPDQSVTYIITDPPYYDAIPYADLSDFCYVWLKRMVGDLHPDFFKWELTPKAEEIIMDPGPPREGEQEKTKEFFESMMKKALMECRRILRPDGVAVVLFAHKKTEGWEALLNALIGAGWTVTASWPIETERGARMRAKGSAVLESSIFLVCRPRTSNEIGDWRDVYAELQVRVREWMQRLVKEEIMGADAIFACIGPALEIFSRYERVETVSGEEITLKKYLEYLWATVAREAMRTIAEQYLEGADPHGFEEDARLTAMWLWTAKTKRADEKKSGFILEYDAARKIAQGLGVNLEALAKPGGIVEIKGNEARLVLVAERRKFLLSKTKQSMPKKREKQMTLFGEIVKEETQTVLERGKTVLDRLHQAMLLFADGNLAGLKYFLVNEGVGREDLFWRLANALSALYPANSDEKRWVDGLLARKKALGL